MPRDFLAEAERWLKTPKSLREMIEGNKEYVISKLLNLLEEGGTYERKYAAFSLGQIGNSDIITQLRKCLEKETVQGVKDALEASLTALNIASVEKGQSECNVIITPLLFINPSFVYKFLNCLFVTFSLLFIKFPILVINKLDKLFTSKYFSIMTIFVKKVKISFFFHNSLVFHACLIWFIKIVKFFFFFTYNI